MSFGSSNRNPHRIKNNLCTAKSGVSADSRKSTQNCAKSQFFYAKSVPECIFCPFFGVLSAIGGNPTLNFALIIFGLRFGLSGPKIHKVRGRWNTPNMRAQNRYKMGTQSGHTHGQQSGHRRWVWVGHAQAEDDLLACACMLN